jgi:pilus assembly protein CpaC
MRVNNRLLPFLMGLLAAVAPAAGQSAPTDIAMTVGSSRVIDCPADLTRISTSDPAVVDVVSASRREVLLQAKGLGQATVGVWSKDGERAFYAVLVGFDLAPIRKLVGQTFPNEAIEVQGYKDALALTGRASSQIVADRAAALLAPFAKGVVNNLAVAPPGIEKQVLLRVRFAELNRTAASSFGTGLVSTGAGNTVGRVTTGQFPMPQLDKISSTGASTFNVSDALNIFAFRPDLNLAAFIQALRNQGLLQMLAEPNLVTTDGKEASFLVGGEFPVPIVQGGGGSNAVSVVFREFGIRLAFKPEITANQTIKMHVKPEVSALDPANGVTLSGFNIPALATRRMETYVELAEGQSFVIAGLLDDRLTENLSRIPGLSQIPLFGSLFKSKSDNRTKTELVVIVTPSITDPLEAARRMPEPAMLKDFLPPAPAAIPKDRR